MLTACKILFSVILTVRHFCEFFLWRLIIELFRLQFPSIKSWYYLLRLDLNLKICSNLDILFRKALDSFSLLMSLIWNKHPSLYIKQCFENFDYLFLIKISNAIIMF